MRINNPDASFTLRRVYKDSGGCVMLQYRVSAFFPALTRKVRFVSFNEIKRRVKPGVFVTLDRGGSLESYQNSLQLSSDISNFPYH